MSVTTIAMIIAIIIIVLGIILTFIDLSTFDIISKVLFFSGCCLFMAALTINLYKENQRTTLKTATFIDNKYQEIINKENNTFIKKTASTMGIQVSSISLEDRPNDGTKWIISSGNDYYEVTYLLEQEKVINITKLQGDTQWKK
ncbi:hypothetical protein [Gottfriedia solisilvae]|uniref:hypothetical protein n=1 Tax=Gottfriedia solisilvae TaxID=1516104 RepID=UPI003D2F241E